MKKIILVIFIIFICSFSRAETLDDVATYIKNNIACKPDGSVDYWQTPEETIKNKTGDCMESNVEILVKNGIKKIKDVQVGDEVLSYNYTTLCYEYKKIVNKWNKGMKYGKTLKLRNGTSIITTKDHRFYLRIGQKSNSDYKITKVSDFVKSGYCRLPSIHCVSKLPVNNIKIDHNKAYLFGIYLAEGYSDGKGHVCIAQDKLPIRKKIESALDALSVPYSKSKRTVHAYYGILKGEFKEELKKLGSNSFNKIIPEEFLNWDKDSIKHFIDGLLDGDGYRRDKLGDSSLWEFSTSSDNVAKMFLILSRKVYGNVHCYKQMNHQGVGKHPSYRLRYFPTGYNNREIFPSIGLVSVKSVEDTEKEYEFYDIEVEDNHNFILAESGIVSHNCEDFTLLAYSMLKNKYKCHIIKIYTLPDQKQDHLFLLIDYPEGGLSYINNGNLHTVFTKDIDKIIKRMYKNYLFYKEVKEFKYGRQ